MALGGAAWSRTRTGLRLEVRTADGAVGRRDPAPLDAATAAALAPPDRPFVARWRGLLDAGAGGERRVSARSDGGVRVWIDGVEAVARRAGARNARTDGTIVLAPGHRRIEVELEGPARDLRLRLQAVGGVPVELWRDGLSTAVHPATTRVLLRAVDRAGAVVAAAWTLAALLGLALLANTPGPHAWRVAAALAVVVTVFGAALRFDALLDRYWRDGRPAWAERARPLLGALHPDALRWEPVETPYEGDPYAYLRHARNMRHFYEARFREPFFVAAAKAGLAVAGGRDLGISLASMAFSALTVLAVYALGAAAFSPAVGLVAAAGLAIDRWMIELSVEGWRDDTFAFWVVVSALCAVKLYDRGERAWAIALGAALAAATLTRITSFSLALPLLAVLAAVPRARPRAERLRSAVLAAVVFLALVAPFLVSCWIAYGDPFHSINAVAPAYYASAGPPPADASVGHLLRTRFHPFELLDTVLVGFTSYPFAGKWRFEPWWPPLGPLLAGLAVAGAAVALLLPRGRLLWLAWACAQLPFVFTWNVPGGDAPRLTTHAYPFYLVAAGFALWAILRLLTVPADRQRARERLRAVPPRLAAVTALVAVAVAWAAIRGLNYLKVREALHAGRPATIAAGYRDAFFFGDGWSRPRSTGNLSMRRAEAPAARIRLPLGRRVDHRLVIRMDPRDTAAVLPSVRVAMNGTPLGVLRLSYDPERVGTYAVAVPAAAERDGDDELELQPDAPIALWYVRVEPAAPSS